MSGHRDDRPAPEGAHPSAGEVWPVPGAAAPASPAHAAPVPAAYPSADRDLQATPAQIAAWAAADDGADCRWPGPPELDDDEFGPDNAPPAGPELQWAAMTAVDGPVVPETVAAGFTHRLRGSRPGNGFDGGGPLDLLEPGPVLAGFTAGAARAAGILPPGVAPVSPGPGGAAPDGATPDGATPGGAAPGGAAPGGAAPGGAAPGGAAPGEAALDEAALDEAMRGGAVPGAPAMMDGAAGGAGLDDDELVGVICAWRRLASWAAAGETMAVAELGRRRAAQARTVKNGRHLVEHLDDEVAAALTLTGRAAARTVTLAAGLDRLAGCREALATGVIDWPRAVVFADELDALDHEDALVVEGRVLPGAGELTTSGLRAALRRAVLEVDPQAAARRRRRGRDDARVEVWEEPSGNAALAGRDLPPAEVLAADRRITAQARWLARRGAPGTLAQLRAAVFTAVLSGQPMPDLLGTLRRGPAVPAPGRAGSGPGQPNAPGRGDAGPAAAGPAELAAGDPGVSPPGVPALTGTINLTLPLMSWLGWTETPGEVAGYGPADAQTCRDLAGLLGREGGARWCLTLTGPGGRAVAHACACRPPPARGSPGADRESPGQPQRAGRCAGGDVIAAWLARLKVNVLEAGACKHRRETPGYRPGAGLRHLLHIRQRTCSFPGCRRPAPGCDDDHTIPWDQGGRTCECNLAPLCRKHHQAKQTTGWQLTQPEPGAMAWMLPSGRGYATRPDPYPV